jgi:hypothetical protein
MAMLSFVVFDHTSGAGVAHADWPLRHAYVFGADDVPVQADVRFADGVIRCEKRSGESAGLCLQFPVDPAADAPLPGTDGAGLGPLTVQTCLLPDRDKPYLLSLELARHRLMMILNKLEDWALFDLPPDHPAIATFERARRAFTAAVVAQGDAPPPGSPEAAAGLPYSAAADRLARQALSLAMEAGELLTHTQARVQLQKRLTGELAAAAAKIAAPPNALTDHEAAESRNALLGNVGVILPTPPQIGVAISPEAFGAGVTKAAQLCSDFICMPMRWVDMEPTEGKYLFGKTDRWIEWAVRTARLPIVAGPLVDFRRGNVPEWLYIWEHDYETLRELVYEHVKTLVTRYRRTIHTWTLCSGLHVGSNFALSFEQVMDLTRLVVMIVRKLHPSGKVQVQIDQPWGEYYASSPRSIPPMMYAEMIQQAGIGIDLVALRVEMGQPEEGRSTRDLMAFSAMLDKYASLDRPIALAAVGCPSRPPEAESLGLDRQFDPGFLRHPWSPASQVSWMTQALAVAAAKPFVHSVCWHELYEPQTPSANHYTGLIDAGGAAKPSLWRLGEIRKAVKDKQQILNLPAAPTLGAL